MSARPEEPTPPASLHELQRFLDATFMRSEPVVDDAALATECAKWVSGNERLSPAEQVDIYRRQFWLRHDESLGDDFLGLKRIVGDDAFHDLSRRYLAAYPPHTPSLRDLGKEMLAFIDSAGLAPSIAGMAHDMVRYELAFIEVFDGPDPPPLDAARLSALSPEAWQAARIVLSPLVYRLRLSYPVQVLRKQVRERAVAEEAGEGDLGPEPPLPEQRESLIAVFRRNHLVHFEELEPTAFALLESLAAGQTLVEACAVAATLLPEDEAAALGPKVGLWFQRWASWGFIADVVTQ